MSYNNGPSTDLWYLLFGLALWIGFIKVVFFGG